MTETNENKTNNDSTSAVKLSINKKTLIPVAFIVVLIALGYVLYRNKSMLVVAKVDNTYIMRSELNSEMTQRYGATTLEDLITLTLVKNALTQSGIEVTKDEMNVKFTELEATLGGMSIDDALKAQGMTRAAFDEQVKLQIGVEKLLQDKVTVADSEVVDYIAKNTKTMTAKDDAGKKTEAMEILKQPK